MPTLVLRIADDLAADIEAEDRRHNSSKSEVAPKMGARFGLVTDLVGTDPGGPRDLSARVKHRWRRGRKVVPGILPLSQARREAFE